VGPEFYIHPKPGRQRPGRDPVDVPVISGYHHIYKHPRAGQVRPDRRPLAGAHYFYKRKKNGRSAVPGRRPTLGGLLDINVLLSNDPIQAAIEMLQTSQMAAEKLAQLQQAASTVASELDTARSKLEAVESLLVQWAWSIWRSALYRREREQRQEEVKELERELVILDREIAVVTQAFHAMREAEVFDASTVVDTDGSDTAPQPHYVVEEVIPQEHRVDVAVPTQIVPTEEPVVFPEHVVERPPVTTQVPIVPPVQVVVEPPINIHPPRDTVTVEIVPVEPSDRGSEAVAAATGTVVEKADLSEIFQSKWFWIALIALASA
jgi:hypothetical protein